MGWWAFGLVRVRSHGLVLDVLESAALWGLYMNGFSTT